MNGSRPPSWDLTTTEAQSMNGSCPPSWDLTTGWDQYWDQHSQRPFYVHQESGITTWTAPPQASPPPLPGSPQPPPIPDVASEPPIATGGPDIGAGVLRLMAALEAQRKALPPRAANWEPNEASSSCRVCGGCFTLRKRRHHCRACGLLVCEGCAPKAALMLPSPKRDGTAAMQRACSVCVGKQQQPGLKVYSDGRSRIERLKAGGESQQLTLGGDGLPPAPAPGPETADVHDVDSEEELEQELSLSLSRATPLHQTSERVAAAAQWSIQMDMDGQLTGHADSMARHRKL